MKKFATLDLLVVVACGGSVTQQPSGTGGDAGTGGAGGASTTATTSGTGMGGTAWLPHADW